MTSCRRWRNANVQGWISPFLKRCQNERDSSRIAVESVGRFHSNIGRHSAPIFQQKSCRFLAGDATQGAYGGDLHGLRLCGFRSTAQEIAWRSLTSVYREQPNGIGAQLGVSFRIVGSVLCALDGGKSLFAVAQANHLQHMESGSANRGIRLLEQAQDLAFDVIRNERSFSSQTSRKTIECSGTPLCARAGVNNRNIDCISADAGALRSPWRPGERRKPAQTDELRSRTDDSLHRAMR